MYGHLTCPEIFGMSRANEVALFRTLYTNVTVFNREIGTV